MMKRAYPIMIVAFALLLVGGLWWNAYGDDSVGATASAREDELDEQVFPKDKVVDVKITIDEDDFQDMLDNASAEEMKMASVEYNGIKVDNIGIRTKGNLSLRSVVSSDSDRYSFKLSFDEYISSQTLLGVEKINLNNNYSDATYMREFLTYELAETMGLPTPKYSYVNVYVNGELWGFYLAIEQVGDEYLERNFGNSYGALYKAEFGMGGGGGGMPDFGNLPDFGDFPGFGNQDGGGTGGVAQNRQFPQLEQAPGGQTTEGQAQEEQSSEGQSPGGQTPDSQAPNGGDMQQRGGRGGGGFGGGGGDLAWVDDQLTSYPSLVQKSKKSNDDILIKMLDELNNGSDYESVLNIDDALGYIALNATTVNMDSYLGSNQQNYYLYEDDGIFSILPWDYNMSFGGFGNTNVLIDEPTQGAVADRPLVDKLLQIDEYKEKYHDMIRTAVDGYLSDEAFSNRVAELQALISPYVKADPRPFFTYEQYESAIPELVAFNATNAASFADQLDGKSPSTNNGNGSGGGFGGGMNMGAGNFGGGMNIGAGNFGGRGGNRQNAQGNTTAVLAPQGNAQRGQQVEAQGGMPLDGAQGNTPPGGVQGQQGGMPPDGQGFQALGGDFPGFGQNGAMPGFGGAASTPAESGSMRDVYATLGALGVLGAVGAFITLYKRRRL